LKLSNKLSALWTHLPRNKPAFFFVSFFVVYGFANISPILWLSIILAAFGLYCEYEAQWVWGYAMAAKKLKKPWKRWAAVNMVYIFILALPTFIGFVYTEIATRNEETRIIEQTQTNNQAYIDNLNKQIGTLSGILSGTFLGSSQGIATTGFVSFLVSFSPASFSSSTTIGFFHRPT